MKRTQKAEEQARDSYISRIRSKSIIVDKEAENKRLLDKMKQQYQFEARMQELEDHKVREEIMRKAAAYRQREKSQTKPRTDDWKAYKTPVKPKLHLKLTDKSFTAPKSPRRNEQQTVGTELVKLLERAKREQEKQKRELEVLLQKSKQKAEAYSSDEKRILDLRPVNKRRLEAQPAHSRGSPKSNHYFEPARAINRSSNHRHREEYVDSRAQEEYELNKHEYLASKRNLEGGILDDFDDSLDTENMYLKRDRAELFNDQNLKTPERRKQ